jgi:predicted phosphodiesterase
MEREARAKQREKLKEIKLRGTPHPRQTAEYKFYVHAESVAKEKQRVLRKMAAPQYSDITYFGHKHKPKKHLPYAMRYCKECGIRH